MSRTPGGATVRLDSSERPAPGIDRRRDRAPFRAPTLAPVVRARIALATLAERRAYGAADAGRRMVARAHAAVAERHTRAALRCVEHTLTLDTAPLAADLIHCASHLATLNEIL